MDYTPKRKRANKPEKSALLEAYPHDLQLYKVPPIGQISLVEFQDLALERQKGIVKIFIVRTQIKCYKIFIVIIFLVLQLLELTLAQQHKSIDEIKLAFTSALRKEGYHAYARLVNAQGCSSHAEIDLEARRRDHIAHFVLRLAYSLKDDLQNHMLTYETELFKLRFNSLNRDGLTQFLATSDLHYSPVSIFLKYKI